MNNTNQTKAGGESTLPANDPPGGLHELTPLQCTNALIACGHRIRWLNKLIEKIPDQKRQQEMRADIEATRAALAKLAVIQAGIGKKKV